MLKGNLHANNILRLSDRGDSNSRPLRPERSTLPTALLSECNVIWIAGAKIRISERNTK